MLHKSSDETGNNINGSQKGIIEKDISNQFSGVENDQIPYSSCDEKAVQIHQRVLEKFSGSK